VNVPTHDHYGQTRGRGLDHSPSGNYKNTFFFHYK